MCRVGIIGGTFDPIHLAHIYIAEEAKKKLNLDKVIFMPAGIQPLKTDKKVTEASLRLEMVQKAIEGKIGFEVSDYEIKKEGKSYTYKTLEHFYKEYKDLYFITGADCLLGIDKWKEIDKIFSLCKFVVFTRPGYNNEELVNKKRFVEEKYNGDIILLEVPGIHISSTDIREKIINNEKVDDIGGTFDPIHLAHIYIAEEAKKKLNLDKVIFMPAGIQPLKTDKKVTEASLRLEMVQKAIEGKIGFEVSDYEIKKEGKSYTYKTLEHFYKEYKDLYFITGADCLLDIDKWKEIEKIFSLCKFVVFTRPGYNNNELVNKKRFVEEKYNGDIILLEVPGIHISSTEIREKIINNEKVDDILPAVVLDIIKEKGLYREH